MQYVHNFYTANIYARAEIFTSIMVSEYDYHSLFSLLLLVSLLFSRLLKYRFNILQWPCCESTGCDCNCEEKMTGLVHKKGHDSIWIHNSIKVKSKNFLQARCHKS